MWLLPSLRRHLRPIAALALLAWLSALSVGLANCYLVQSHEFGKHLPIASAHRAASDLSRDARRSLHTQVVDDGAAAGGGNHNTDTGKDGCDRFCVDESSTVAKADTDQPDLLGLVRFYGADWQPLTPLLSASIWRSVERQVSQGLPLFLLLLRLAN